jgi:16S rRNA (guanine527-N7)-methyltransferase
VCEPTGETEFAARIERRAPDFGLAPLPPERRDGLARFLSELARWKTATDLVGNLSEDALVDHALESAFGGRLLGGEDAVVDIGSGAGFPGVPLAIFGAAMTLLEPRSRRAAFLRHVLRALPGLNASVAAGRVERLPDGRYSAATARAVGGLGRAVGEGKFLNENGRLLVWTTDADNLKADLATAFRLERRIPIPQSRRREIAVFRKCSTGNIGVSDA